VYIYRVNSEKQLGDPARSARFGLSQRSVITGNGTVRDGDEFGAALAIGDFDGDGKMDLAIGAPGASRPSPVLQPRSGYVALYRGDSSAMVSPWSTLASTGLAQARVGDRFGAALAAGDLNGDGKADLAVGAPETASTKIGAVYVFVGGAPTLPGAAPLKGVQQLHAQTTGPAQVTALFGSALAVGRFEKGFGTASQLKTSLVVGAPYYGPDGEIQIYSTNGSGGASFQMTLAQTLTHPNPGDRLGSVLAAVRLGTDAGDTLIAGLPLRDRASLSDTGGYVMYTANKLGGAPPLLAPGTLLENPLPIAAPGDRFGSSIAVAGIYNALTGRPEGTRLVIGAEGRLAAGVFAVRLPTYWLPVHQEYVVKE
jgi:hypothetical protein